MVFALRFMPVVAISLVVAAKNEPIYSELAKRVAPADESMYLRCMHCYSEHYIFDCLGVIKCLRYSEVCLIQKYYDSYYNQTFIKAGCTTKKYCDSIGCFDETGSIENSISIGDNKTLECNHCCDTEFCNIYGCPESGELGFLSSPRCLHCTFVDYPHDCPDMINCATDSICVLNVVVHGGVERYNVGCEKTKICETGFNTTFHPHHKRQVLHHPELGIMLHSDCCADHLCNSVFPIRSNAAMNHSNYICPPKVTLPPTTTTSTTIGTTFQFLTTTSHKTTRPHTIPTKPQILANSSHIQATTNGPTASTPSSVTQIPQSVIHSQIQPPSSLNFKTQIFSSQTSYVKLTSSVNQVTHPVSQTISSIQQSTINQLTLPVSQTISSIQQSTINQVTLPVSQTISRLQQSTINQVTLPVSQIVSSIQQSTINQVTLPVSPTISSIQQSSINQVTLPVSQTISSIQQSTINQGTLPVSQTISSIQQSTINQGTLPVSQTISSIQQSTINQGTLPISQTTFGTHLSSTSQVSIPVSYSSIRIQQSSTNQIKPSTTIITSGLHTSSLSQVPVSVSQTGIQTHLRPSVSRSTSSLTATFTGQLSVPVSTSYSTVQGYVPSQVLSTVLQSISGMHGPVSSQSSSQVLSSYSGKQSSSYILLPISSSILSQTSSSSLFRMSNQISDLTTSFSATPTIKTSATQMTSSTIPNTDIKIPSISNYGSMTQVSRSQISKLISTMKPKPAVMAFSTQILSSSIQKLTSNIKMTQVLPTSSSLINSGINLDASSSLQVAPTFQSSSTNVISTQISSTSHFQLTSTTPRTSVMTVTSSFSTSPPDLQLTPVFHTPQSQYLTTSSLVNQMYTSVKTSSYNTIPSASSVVSASYPLVSTSSVQKSSIVPSVLIKPKSSSSVRVSKVVLSASTQPMLMSSLPISIKIPSVTKTISAPSVSTQLKSVTASSVLNNVSSAQQQTPSFIDTRTQSLSIVPIQNTHQPKLMTSFSGLQQLTSGHAGPMSHTTINIVSSVKPLVSKATNSLNLMASSLPKVYHTSSVFSLTPVPSTTTSTLPVSTQYGNYLSNYETIKASTKTLLTSSIQLGFDQSSIQSESTKLNQLYVSNTVSTLAPQNMITASDKSTTPLPVASSEFSSASRMMKQTSVKLSSSVLMTSKSDQNTFVSTMTTPSSTDIVPQSPSKVITMGVASSQSLSGAVSKMAVIYPTKSVVDGATSKPILPSTTKGDYNGITTATYSDIPDLISSVILPSKISSWVQNTDFPPLQSSLPPLTPPAFTQSLHVSATEDTLVYNPTQTLMMSLNEMQTMIATTISSDLDTTSSVMITDIVSSEASTVIQFPSSLWTNIPSGLTKESTQISNIKSASIKMAGGFSAPVNIQPIG